MWHKSRYLLAGVSIKFWETYSIGHEIFKILKFGLCCDEIRATL
jgi:hypothetical protein